LFYAFLLYAPCQFQLLFNLGPLIFRLTLFGWQRSIALTPASFITYYGNIILDLRLVYLHALFQELPLGRKERAWCTGLRPLPVSATS
jgi:hypothetical protein